MIYLSRDSDSHPVVPDPLVFINDVLGVDLWSAQKGIISDVWEGKFTSVRACHSAGMTFTAAVAALTFLHAHEEAGVYLTAPTQRQLDQVLFRSVRVLCKRAKQPIRIHPHYSQSSLANSRIPLLVVADEAGSIGEGEMGDIISNLPHTARLLMVGKATRNNEFFRYSHQPVANEFLSRRIPWEDTPNAIFGKAIYPYLTTQTWVDAVIKNYGEDSDYVRTRVGAEFAA